MNPPRRQGKHQPRQHPLAETRINWKLSNSRCVFGSPADPWAVPIPPQPRGSGIIAPERSGIFISNCLRGEGALWMISEGFRALQLPQRGSGSAAHEGLQLAGGAGTRWWRFVTFPSGSSAGGTRSAGTGTWVTIMSRLSSSGSVPASGRGCRAEVVADGIGRQQKSSGKKKKKKPTT